MSFVIRHAHAGTFRRSGVAFENTHWVKIDEPTPEQLAEPRLIVLEYDGTDFPELKGLPITEVPDPVVATEEAEAEPEKAPEIPDILTGVSYPNLQKLAKAYGIKATLGKEALLVALEDKRAELADAE